MKRPRRRRSGAPPPRPREPRTRRERKNPVVAAAQRVRALRWIALASFVLLVLRLGWMQIVQGEHWRREAELTRTKKVALNAPRGRIFDRSGLVIADNRRAWDLEIDLSRMLERGRCAPLALSLWLRHLVALETLTEKERERLSIEGVIAEPEHAVERLLATDIATLAAIRSSVARLEIQEWGRGLLLASGATKLPLAAVRSALNGEGAGELGARLEVDRELLLRHVRSWCERLSVLEHCVGANGKALGEFLEVAHQECCDYVATRIASELDPGASDDEAERVELKSRLEWWRRSRQRARVWAKDLEYDPAVFFLAQHADAFPGFDAQLRLRREYASDAGFALIGSVAAPTEEERRIWEVERQRLLELRRLLQRSDEEQTELEMLQARLGVELVSPTEIRGRSGLEVRFEEVLRGQRGLRLAEWDGFLDRPRSEESIVEIQPVPGDDLHLTLDLPLQAEAEALLARAPDFVRVGVTLHREFVPPDGVPRGALVVIDARRGDVVVAASCPAPTRDEVRRSYEALALAKPGRPLYPRAFRPYSPPQPGSVFKTFVALSVLDELGVSPDEALPCNSFFEPTKQKCENHSDPQADLWLALEKSCNVYFYRRARELGARSLTDLSVRFGFGQPTGFELDEEIGEPREAQISKAERATGSQLTSFGIGQVVPHVTPLQMARAYAAVACGELPTLRLVSAIGTRELPLGERRNVGVSEHAFDVVREALARCVDRGTAKDLGELRWKVAGKTGTAESYDVTIGDHSWFAGWLPREDPRWVIVVFCERCGAHGGDLAVPLAKAFFESAAWSAFAEREAER